MKKVFLSFVFLSAAALVLSGAALAGPGMNPAKFCKDGGTELIATVLEDALAGSPHGGEVELVISQGACASTVASHAGQGGVNTTALAVDFCKQAVEVASEINFCVEHVEPFLAGIFHPAPE